MSDPREQSYYEIALTNRQVMTIFVVLLVCVLAAFLGGVWVGRGDEITVTTTEPAEIESGARPGEPPLEVIDFFSETASPDTAESAADLSVAENREPPAAPAESPQPVILEEIGSARPQAQAPQSDPSGSAAAISQSPEPARPAAAVPVPGEALVVQVFSSTDQAQAQRILERVRGGGYPAVMSSGDVDGKPMYRVRVGPYSDRDEAQGVADRIRRAYKLDTWITR